MPIEWKEARLASPSRTFADDDESDQCLRLHVNHKDDDPNWKATRSFNHAEQAALSRHIESDSSGISLSPPSLFSPSLQKNPGSTIPKDEKILCHGCFNEIPYFQLRKHLADACRTRILRCNYPACDGSYLAFEKNIHDRHECAAVRIRRSLQKSVKSKRLPEHKACPKCGNYYSEKTLRDHTISTCPHRAATCSFCLEVTEERLIQQHLKRHVEHRNALAKRRQQELEDLTICSLCSHPVVSRNLTKHQLRQCSHRIVECPNAGVGCNSQVPKHSLATHLKDECSVSSCS